MKKLSKEELTEVLAKHEKWLHGEAGGVRADLSNTDLSNADLSNIDLNYADLSNTDLSNADLSNIDLNYADLSGANLANANLSYSILKFVDLHDAVLHDANLSGVFLFGANLLYADLRGANLCDTVLDRANLSGAGLTGAKGPLIEFRRGKILTKPLIGYKQCRNNVIVTLEIPKGATVFSINGYKCRTNRVKVVAIDGADKAVSWYKYMSYYVGDEITINDFDCDYSVECTTGIHFFMTRREAKIF